MTEENEKGNQQTETQEKNDSVKLKEEFESFKKEMNEKLSSKDEEINKLKESIKKKEEAKQMSERDDEISKLKETLAKKDEENKKLSEDLKKRTEEEGNNNPDFKGNVNNGNNQNTEESDMADKYVLQRNEKGYMEFFADDYSKFDNLKRFKR